MIFTKCSDTPQEWLCHRTPHKHQTLQKRAANRSLVAIVLSFGLGLVLALAPLLPSAAISVADVPNPRQVNGTWVSDTADLLSDRTEAQLNQMIAALETKNGTEIAVVTVPNTQPSATPTAFTTELFNTWGIGKADVNNGVLFLVSKDERRTEVETGSGVSDRLSNTKVSTILEQQVTPQFKAGNFDAGVLAGTEAIITSLDEAAGSSALLPTPQFDYWGWMVSNSWIWVVAIATITTQQIKMLGQALNRSLKVTPTGNSELSATSGFLQPLKFWLLRILVGTDMVRTKGLSLESPSINNTAISSVLPSAFTANDSTTHTVNTSAQVNRLANYQRSKAMVQSGQTIFLTLLGLSVLTITFLQANPFELILAAWLWLGYEASLSSQAILKIRTDTTDGWPRVAVSYFIQSSLTILAIILLLLMLLSALAFLLLPFVTVSLLGSCAGIVRLVRQLPEDACLKCNDCNEAMQRLSGSQLQQYISKAKQVEIQLKTKSYEGWCCPNCRFDSYKKDRQIHLFSNVLSHSGYETCRDCNALTVKVEREILTKPTTTSKGKKIIKKRCHCCDDYQEQELDMPKIRHRSASDSESSRLASGYSGDYSSYSSSDYSSGSSGDSFGGGSSDGDGAGDGW